MPTQNGNVQIVAGRNERNEHVFSVLVKRSYRIANGQVAARADTDAPFRLIDEYYDNGDPDWSTVKHEGELSPYKAVTDVVVIGTAHAPNGKPTDRMTVSVEVGERKKELVVTGDRRCHHRPQMAPVFSEVLPFVEMEIRYDYAYGGHDERSDPTIPFHYPRNFMGKGVVLRNVREVVEGLPLPNIEAPNDLLTPERVIIEDPAKWHLQPLPQGFGWRQRTWYPRNTLLGGYPPFLTVGTVTAEERMGLLQRNHIAFAKQSRLAPREAAFNNGASLGLLFGTLPADERIRLCGLTPEGAFEFSLPGDTPIIALDLGESMQSLSPRLHIVSIRPDDLAMDIVWRGALIYPGPAWLPKMERLEAEVL